jgi:hypothetical protein
MAVCPLCGTGLLQDLLGNFTLPAGEPFAGDAVPWDIVDDSPAAATTPGPGLPMADPAPGPVANSADVPVAPPATPARRCLVLYGPDKKPVHPFPLRKDVTVIGRRDALRGNFPDIDLSQWLGEYAARAVSRKHALLLHTRADDSFVLRPLAGNTGTQIEQDMVEPLKDYPLKPGVRLILGGKVRFKFEIDS